MLPASSTLIYTDPGAVFALEMQLTLIAGTILASPYVMFRYGASSRQASTRTDALRDSVRRAVVAGHRRQRRVQSLRPVRLRDGVLRSFNRPELQFLPSVDSVFSLYTKMLIGMALTFQLPTVVFFLTQNANGDGTVAGEEHQATRSCSSSSLPRCSRPAPIPSTRRSSRRR